MMTNEILVVLMFVGVCGMLMGGSGAQPKEAMPANNSATAIRDLGMGRR